MNDRGHYDMEDLVRQIGLYLAEMLPPQSGPDLFRRAEAQADAERAPAPGRPLRAKRRRAGASNQVMREEAPSYAPLPSGGRPADRELGDLMDQLEETFQERLFGMIRERGLDETRIYKKAGLDRKLFSKIRCSRTYRPGKETVLALSLAMELNLDECRDLLSRAGLALSPASRSDLIIRYCIEHEIYDLMIVNTLLDRFGEACLFVS